MGLAVRFFQKAGASVTAAAAVGLIDSVSGWLALASFGYPATFVELLLLNTLVSLFAGLMPVPGGIGVTEAALTAGLVAIGIPDAAALSTALVFRVATYYLPPVYGAPAMRWLRRSDYV